MTPLPDVELWSLSDNLMCYINHNSPKLVNNFLDAVGYFHSQGIQC